MRNSYDVVEIDNSFGVHCRIFISDNTLFLSIDLDLNMPNFIKAKYSRHIFFDYE